jgi:spoIIIJ-associated protein
MEWVETTGRTVAEALDTALDQLGVDEDEVEFEVLVEPKGRLFSRFGGAEARIRARVKPLSREKPGEARRRGRQRSGAARDETRSSEGRADQGGGAASSAPPGKPTGGRRRRGPKPVSSSGDRPRESEPIDRSRADRPKGDSVESETIPINEQAEAAEKFTRGLLKAFGADATLAVQIDGDAVLVDVDGPDLGLLVGPRGVTLRAIEELVRSVVQRQAGGHGVRINVDVGGYQAKRRTALEAFTRELAAKVVETGRDQALEPMPAADRKVVHDTVAEIEGVATVSEGDEPRRRVVLRRS